MSKYINSDRLRHLFKVWKEIEEKAGNDKGAYCYNECINAIDKISSADVVDVVYCKDCKYLIEIDDTSNLYVCDRIDIGMDGEPNFLKPEIDFCSYGERNDSNE